MNFSATAYKNIKERASITTKSFNCGLVIVGLGFLFYMIDHNVSPRDQFGALFFWLMLLAFIPIGFSYIYQYWDFENITISEPKILAFNERSFTIDSENTILHETIKELKINIDAFYNERINMMIRTPLEQKSQGVKNKITIKTDSETFEFFIKLQSSLHRSNFEEILFNLVMQHKLENLHIKQAVKLIAPRFKNSDEYKGHIIDQIKSGKISCTEGLLLHGYTSDQEARELRKKYCA